MIDEMERSVHDALCVVRRVIESNVVCPGGGACEAALSIYLGWFLYVSCIPVKSHTFVRKFRDYIVISRADCHCRVC